MKKVLSIAIALMMVLALVACTAEDTTKVEEAVAEVEQAVEEVAAEVEAEVEAAAAEEATAEEAAPAEEAAVEEAAEEVTYVAYTFDLKNKSGQGITELYIYPAGGATGASLIEDEWPDKDTDGEAYEFYAYILRPESDTFTVGVVYADGTEAEFTYDGVANYDKFSLKAYEPDGWEHEACDDAEDIAAMDALAAEGLTTDGFYPTYVYTEYAGYKILPLELKNKTEHDISALYIVPAGEAKDSRANIVEHFVDVDGNAVGGNWAAGKGGFYLYSYIYVPEDCTALDIYIEFADGTAAVESLNNSDIFSVDADGNAFNEISFKDAADPDLWKIQFDDGSEVHVNIQASMNAGLSLDGFVPEA